MTWGQPSAEFRWSGRAWSSVAITAFLTLVFAGLALLIPSSPSETLALATAFRILAGAVAIAFAIAGILYARTRLVEVDSMGIRARGITRTDFDVRWDDLGTIEVTTWGDQPHVTWATLRGRDGKVLGVLAPHLELRAESGARFEEVIERLAAARGIPVVGVPFRKVGAGEFARPREPIHPR